MSTATAARKPSKKPAAAATANARDDQGVVMIVGRDNDNKIPLAFLSRRDNHNPAATAKITPLTVAAFSSRLSRYTLLLIGFAGGFRRSAIVGLNCDDLERVRQGLIFTLRRSKARDAVGMLP